MSKSYRTQPPRIIANKNLDSLNSIAVVERKCLKNDIYPLNKAMIKEYIAEIPEEYIYGLKGIELLDRNSREIGNPYAIYREDEKLIKIYSVLRNVWMFKNLDQGVKNLYIEHGALVDQRENLYRITWKDPLDLAYFMFVEVLLHELGHHFINQYRYRNKPPKKDLENEKLADLHALRISKKTIFYDIWKNNA